MRELFAKILYETEKHNDLILVTLIDSDGSAPRKTGSQMLVSEKGRILGTIGGGAVEMRSIEMVTPVMGRRRKIQREREERELATPGSPGGGNRYCS